MPNYFEKMQQETLAIEKRKNEKLKKINTKKNFREAEHEFNQKSYIVLPIILLLTILIILLIQKFK